MGLPGLSTPIVYPEPIDRAPACNLTKITEWECQYKQETWHNWYKADLVYAQGTVYAYLIVIGFFTLIQLKRQFGFGRFVPARISATYGYLGSRRFAFGRWQSPPLGALILVAILIVYTSAMSLGPKPYYWYTMALGHSPPLATRSGWISLAMLPFTVILAAKFNWVTLLTGVSHEKLQVFHRWSAWMMYLTALLHTFPFIRREVKYGTWSETYKESVYFWTGMAALAVQTWLTIFSIGPIRNAFYETFKALHRVAALLFVIFMFIHCNNTLTSWNYFVALIPLYGLLLLFRLGRTAFRGVHRAEIQDVGGRMVKVTLRSTTLACYPGQHVFLRFFGLGIHNLTNHPFTIANTMQFGTPLQEVVFYIKAHAGLTARLASKAGPVSVLVDGPYGSQHEEFAGCDKVLLIAGGSGGSYVLSKLQDIADRRLQMDVVVVWATRTNDSLHWFKEAAQKSAQQLKARMHLHVTAESSSLEKMNSPTESLEKGSPVTSKEDQQESTHLPSLLSARPNLPQLIKDEAASSKSMVIFSCGPASLSQDVSDTVAGLQLDIVKGKSVCKEIRLHDEAYGW